MAAVDRLLLHFRDGRPPQEIQFQLERRLMSLFRPVQPGDARSGFAATAKTGAIVYRFLLRLEAATWRTNHYSLRMEAECPSSQARESCQSWFDLWTRDFTPAPPPGAGEGSPDRFEAVAGRWLNAETHLVTVADVQQEILAALRNGAMFFTAHKEGGSHIAFRNGQFSRTDYGESNAVETFASTGGFLAFLRKFFDYETSRHAWPERVPELDAWRLIARLLDRGRAARTGGGLVESGWK